MDKTRLLTVIEELGEAIQQYKAAREDSNAEIEYLRHELKEHQSIIVALEKEIAGKDAEIQRLTNAINKFCIKKFETLKEGVQEGTAQEATNEQEN